MSSSVGRMFSRMALVGKFSSIAATSHQSQQVRLIHSSTISVNKDDAKRVICVPRNTLHLSALGKMNMSSEKLKPRKVIVEDLSVDGKHFCVELMNQYDSDLASRFGFEHIRFAEPLTVALNCSPDDVEIHYFDQCKRSIDSRTSLIVFDKAKKPANSRSELKDPDAIILISTQELTEKNRPPPKEFRFKEDYGHDVEMGGYLRRNANRVHVLTSELLSQFPFFVPPNTTKIGVVESYCFREEYYGIGLTEKVFEEGMKVAKANGVEYLAVICLLSDLRRVCHQLNFRPFMDFPLDKFKDHGNVVFKPIPNDPASAKATLMIAKL